MNKILKLIISIIILVAIILGATLLYNYLTKNYEADNSSLTEETEKEMNVLKEQAMNEGKPAEIAEKMVEGRLNKFYKEICLSLQAFIKDGDIDVTKYVTNNGGELISSTSFVVGEGIEKRQDNFAEEVMAQING